MVHITFANIVHIFTTCKFQIIYDKFHLFFSTFFGINGLNSAGVSLSDEKTSKQIAFDARDWCSLQLLLVAVLFQVDRFCRLLSLLIAVAITAGD